MAKIQSLHAGQDSTPIASAPVRIPMPVSELRAILREDLACYRDHGGLLAPGFQTLAVYRMLVWIDRLPNRFLRFPLRKLYGLIGRLLCSFHGIELPPTARIGRRLLIAHQSGIVVGSGVVIGDDCLIRQNVTLGAIGSDGPEDGYPVVGDRVQFGAGAVAFGPITIGDDCLIGPNVVIRNSLPAGSLAAPQRPQVRRRSQTPPKLRAAEGA